jgi:hypothetical protein
LQAAAALPAQDANDDCSPGTNAAYFDVGGEAQEYRFETAVFERHAGPRLRLGRVRITVPGSFQLGRF